LVTLRDVGTLWLVGWGISQTRGEVTIMRELSDSERDQIGAGGGGRSDYSQGNFFFGHPNNTQSGAAFVRDHGDNGYILIYRGGQTGFGDAGGTPMHGMLES
jgi:hypothetical protein